MQVPEPLDPNGHEYVEIGGIKWATMNVGATSIADAGLFFQWGDTQGYTANQVGNGEGKKSFISSDYKYKDVTSSEITKYNYTDCKTVLDIEDDAVRANWGGDWRLPNMEEFTTLTDACTSQWINNYQGSGVNGMLFTDKTDVSKTLFFPASGRYIEDELKVKGITGNYWSRSRDANDIYKAHTLQISSSNCSIVALSRYYGLSIRGVLAE